MKSTKSTKKLLVNVDKEIFQELNKKYNISCMRFIRKTPVITVFKALPLEPKEIIEYEIKVIEIKKVNPSYIIKL